VVTVTAITDLPSNAIIVDNLDANFVRYGPQSYWKEATGAQYYLDHTYWTSNTQTIVENYGVWTPTKSLTGPYAVHVFIPSNRADTENAVYQIYHNGQTTTYTLAQAAYFARWVNLGVYTFTAETESYIKLTDLTYEDPYTKMIAFDAVAFVPQIQYIYLPVVMREWPPRKKWTGIHLGNRIGHDWNENDSGEAVDFLEFIDGDDSHPLPAAVVVLSNQVYELERSLEGRCDIIGVHVRSDRDHVYQYLKHMANRNVKVIIRIYPSPGNFTDWEKILEGWSEDHELIVEHRPAGDHYCYDPKGDDYLWTAADYYRGLDDLAREMAAIHNLNQQDGWTEFGFVPANEINIEWYGEMSYPSRYHQQAWSDMGTYFSLLYTYVQEHYGNAFDVFAPPMAQANYAESTDIEDPDCRSMQVKDDYNNPVGIGYDYMYTAYNDSNDGITWNNYFIEGGESTLSCPVGWHVSYYFPNWMISRIMSGERIGIITETDLCSTPIQCRNRNPLLDKDADPIDTASSLYHFISAERVADYRIVWMLNSDVGDSEQDWHEAYSDDGEERDWFRPWWDGPE
jgi:hypothetical protein